MIRSPKVGDHGQLSFVVTEQHIIDFSDEVMPRVLCTPWLIWFLEHAAREAMLPLLECDESTVGVVVNVEHLAPTPIGSTVTCVARVIHVDGPVVSMSLSARDDQAEIARGTHKLRVINKERFARRLASRT